MDNSEVNKLQEQVMAAVKDAVKLQIAKSPAMERGMDSARHAAVLAYAIAEVLSGLSDPSDPEVSKPALRAILTPAILNASQLRQRLEKDGVLKATGQVSDQYSV